MLDHEVLLRMEKESSATRIYSEEFKKRIDLYYTNSGVSLHHLIIATQTKCAVCGYHSKPVAHRARSILVYSSLGKEPLLGTVIPSRCTSKKCRHRGYYGWDVIPLTNGKNIFKPLRTRHCLPFWVCSTDTAFVTSMISKNIHYHKSFGTTRPAST